MRRPKTKRPRGRPGLYKSRGRHKDIESIWNAEETAHETWKNGTKIYVVGMLRQWVKSRKRLIIM